MIERCSICKKIIWPWQATWNMAHAKCDYKLFTKSTREWVRIGIMTEQMKDVQDRMRKRCINKKREGDMRKNTLLWGLLIIIVLTWAGLYSLDYRSEYVMPTANGALEKGISEVLIDKKPYVDSTDWITLATGTSGTIIISSSDTTDAVIWIESSEATSNHAIELDEGLTFGRR